MMGMHRTYGDDVTALRKPSLQPPAAAAATLLWEQFGFSVDEKRLLVASSILVVASTLPRYSPTMASLVEATLGPATPTLATNPDLTPQPTPTSTSTTTTPAPAAATSTATWVTEAVAGWARWCRFVPLSAISFPAAVALLRFCLQLLREVKLKPTCLRRFDARCACEHVCHIHWMQFQEDHHHHHHSHHREKQNTTTTPPTRTSTTTPTASGGTGGHQEVVHSGDN